MMYRVLLDDAAEGDLASIYAHIATQSDERTAYNYIQRILRWCRSLETFPMRGKTRNDISPGLRVAGFERRVAVAFVVERDMVKVTRILYAGREFSSDNMDDTEEN